MKSEQEKDQQEILTVAHHDYEKGLNARAFFKLHNHALGEDLVQDTFMKTWLYLIKGGKIDTMKAFLYHVLNNLIVDQYRKHKTTSLDSLLEKGFEPKINSAERLIDVLDGKATILLIQRLPEMYKKVIQMKYIQNLSIKEISLITGKSKNAVTVELHRGLEKLKRLYFSTQITK
jgi:RNA polymerase sigma-70 factor, ECF subfamily